MSDKNYSAPAVHRAIRLMEALADSDLPLGVAELCRELELNNNMVYRILKTLEQDGWVKLHEPGPKYSLSLRPFHYTSKAVGRLDIKSASRPHLEQLWRETGESCYLGIIDGRRTLFLDHLDSTRSVKVTARPGERFLMHCAAPGKALLAFGPPKLSEQLIEEGLEAQSPSTITDGEQLFRELEKIRSVGYSTDLEEYGTGIICFAVPVFNHNGELEGTVGLSVLKLHYSVKEMISRLGPKVLACGKAISAALGYSGEYPVEHGSAVR